MISLKKYICKRQSIFFSHAFTIILMNCNVCILQLQKKIQKKTKKKKNKQKPQTKPKKNQKIQKTKHKQTSDCLKI